MRCTAAFPVTNPAGHLKREQNNNQHCKRRHSWLRMQATRSAGPSPDVVRNPIRNVLNRLATQYCQKLRLAGYSDWRLPKIYELQDIYDADLETPGLAGPGKGRNFTWHVEGGLLLSGDEWSSTRGLDDRGHPSGYAWYFDFNEGQRFNVDEPSAGKRALCVRPSGK